MNEGLGVKMCVYNSFRIFPVAFGLYNVECEVDFNKYVFISIFGLCIYCIRNQIILKDL